MRLQSSRLSLVLEIAQRMQDPRTIQALMNDSLHHNADLMFTVSSTWNDVSLGGGYSGLLLLFSTLQQKGLLERNQEGIVHQFVLKIKEVIEAEGLRSLSVYSGVTGICFAVQQASLGGIRYQNMQKALDEYLFRNIEQSYFIPLREDILLKRPSFSTLYDVIQGLSGIGRYAVENLSDSRLHELVKEIIVLLIARLQPFMVDGYLVPGWYLSLDDPIHNKDDSAPSKVNFNLGVAHGVTGILALFSIASMRGVQVEGQQDAIRGLSNWICKKSFLENGSIQWLDAVTFEEEIGKVPLRKAARQRPAWCYGVLGISRTLFLAGKALHDQELKNFAMTAFRQIFTRAQGEWRITTPSLCHGMAGFLLIAHEMMKEGGCDDLSAKLDELEQSLLGFYNSDFPLGFKNAKYDKNGSLTQVNDSGFLEGTAGILLTLLHLSSPSSEWHLPLLIK